MNTTMRATYTKRGHYWHGAIKVGKEVVWVCEHSHHNRDQTTRYRGQSATDCAHAELRRRERSALPPRWYEFCQVWADIALDMWRAVEFDRANGIAR